MLSQQWPPTNEHRFDETLRSIAGNQLPAKIDDGNVAVLAALRRSEERLKLAIRSGDIGIWEWHIDSGEVLWSAEACELVGAPGVTRTSLEVFQSIVDEADRPQLQVAIQAALSGNARFVAEFRIHRLSDGALRWVVNNGEVIRDVTGRPTAMVGVVRDITERKELETVLRQSRDAAIRRATEVQIWLEGSPAIVWIAHDRDCRFLTGNRAAEELLGLPPGVNMCDVTGQMNGVTQWQDGRRLEPGELPMRRAARGEAVSAVTVSLSFTDGRTIDVRGSAAPLQTENGEPCGAVGTFFDVSAQVRLDEQLRLVADQRAQLLLAEQCAREAAETANRVTSDFIAKVSHELRTPLNVVLGHIHSLESGTVPSEGAASTFEAIRRNLQLQSQLIDDLLDVSRGAQQQFALTLAPVVVNQLITEVAVGVGSRAQQKHIALTCRLDAGDIVITGDERRLRQVFSNLLTNAVKFTPDHGSIDVELSVTDDAVVLIVSDTGIGIDAEFLPRVFDPFTRAERGANFRNTSEGLGLGLNIAQGLVVAHGGTISVSSAGLGRGATFRVTLPRDLPVGDSPRSDESSKPQLPSRVEVVVS